MLRGMVGKPHGVGFSQSCFTLDSTVASNHTDIDMWDMHPA